MSDAPTLRLLIADDQALMRAGFRMILEAQPDLRVVAEAADGVEAVELARRHRPDVILMDIRMPRMDGVEATRRLAGHRVLILTTFNLDEYVVEALRAGASGFLLKDALAELVDHGDGAPELDDVGVGGDGDEHRAAKRLLDLGDPALDPALVLTRLVVARVLAQVALLAGVGDAGDDLGAPDADELRQLLLEGLSPCGGDGDVGRDGQGGSPDRRVAASVWPGSLP